MIFKKRLKFYFVKTPDGGIAACPRTGKPLISPYTKHYKNVLKELLDTIKSDIPDYKDCYISVLKER